MKRIPTPEAILEGSGRRQPEELALRMGYIVQRVTTPQPPRASGVILQSEYQPPHSIILYCQALINTATQRGKTPAQMEQWHIAHELYHALAEESGRSPWHVRERDADAWADALLKLSAEKLEGG